MLASTLESQRVFFQESLQTISTEAKTVVEQKSQEILEHEKALIDLDAEIEAQLLKVDQAREFNEGVRSDFTSYLTRHMTTKKENIELEK